MYLYNAKIADADEDYQWKHPSDVDHPIEPYDADNKLPPHYFRHRSIAKPHFENKTPMNKQELRRMVKEEIKQQFLNESTVTQENVFKNFFKPDTSGPPTYSKEVINDLLGPEYTEGLHYKFYKGIIIGRDEETSTRLRSMLDEFGMLRTDNPGGGNSIFLNKRVED